MGFIPEGGIGLNIPNALSLIRIALVPVFFSLYTRGRVLQAMAVLLLSAATDVLDGAIARRYDMVTDLGKVLDPVADKLIQGAMMLCAAARTPSAWLLLGLHVLRESCLSMVGLYVLRATGRVYGARWYGKVCTAAIYTVMIGLLAFPDIPPRTANTAVLLCAVLIGLCLCLYLTRFMRILRGRGRERAES